MKKKTKLITLFTAVTLIAALAACGAANSGDSAGIAPRAMETTAQAKVADSGYATSDVYYDMAEAEYSYAAEYDMNSAPMPAPEEAPSQSQGDLANRKLIKNANVDVETEYFDDLLAGIDERVKMANAYMESYNVSNNSRYYGTTNNRSAYMTIRVPSASYDWFLNEVARISNVLNRSESTRDVTLEYVDMDSRKKVLTIEHDNLVEILAQAETVEDMITVRNRISDVRYEIERMESQLRTYDNLVDYSTIYLSVSEVKELTPVEELTVWQRIAAGFTGSLKDIGEGFTNFFVWFVVHIPYLLIFAIIVGAVLLIVRHSLKTVKNKKLTKVNIKENAEEDGRKDTTP
ncbi:MAG: DUF4349 domain-containing protein [Lachnospiraceae bacterium]|jgi:hypothetical protein|nr:DUF4349 domain-containing protein [Lachnospiraceae bacterium]